MKLTTEEILDWNARNVSAWLDAQAVFDACCAEGHAREIALGAAVASTLTRLHDDKTVPKAIARGIAAGLARLSHPDEDEVTHVRGALDVARQVGDAVITVTN